MSNQTKAKTTFLCIELLESFNKKELQKFHQFISSPYFNTDQRLIKLYEMLRKEVLRKAFNDQLQSKIYSSIYGSKPNKLLIENEKKTLRTKLSKLNQLAQEFLVSEYLKNHKNSYYDFLFQSLLHKKQFNLFEVIIKREKKRLSINERKDILDFEYLYRLEMHLMGYLNQTGLLYKNSNFKIDSIVEKLNVQYIMRKFILYITILTSKKFQSGYQTSDMISFQNAEYLMRVFDSSNYPILEVFHSIILFLKNPSDSKYKITLNLLNFYRRVIPKIYLNSFYIVILNFLIQEIKKGNYVYEHDLVSLYEKLDEEDLLIEENIMSVPRLKNIIVRMCKLNYFEKANYFIEKYIPYVMKQDQENIRNLCIAHVNFCQKNYESALEYIVKVDNGTVFVDVSYRTLLMKIYFERDQSYNEKTERLCRTMIKFFSDNKLITKENKKACKNFTQILINLYRFKHNEGRMTLEKIHQKLEQQDYNIDKKWLLEKIAELEK